MKPQNQSLILSHVLKYLCYGKQIQSRVIVSPGFISSGFLGSIVGQPILSEMFSCFPQHLNVNAGTGSSNYLVPPVSNN